MKVAVGVRQVGGKRIYILDTKLRKKPFRFDVDVRYPFAESRTAAAFADAAVLHYLGVSRTKKVSHMFGDYNAPFSRGDDTGAAALHRRVGQAGFFAWNAPRFRLAAAVPVGVFLSLATGRRQEAAGSGFDRRHFLTPPS